jgi:hypothetical protein
MERKYFDFNAFFFRLLQFSATKQGLRKKTRRLCQQSMKRKRLSTKVLFDRRENPIFRVLNTLGVYIFTPLYKPKQRNRNKKQRGEKDSKS